MAMEKMVKLEELADDIQESNRKICEYLNSMGISIDDSNIFENHQHFLKLDISEDLLDISKKQVAQCVTMQRYLELLAKDIKTRALVLSARRFEILADLILSYNEIKRS